LKTNNTNLLLTHQPLLLARISLQTLVIKNFLIKEL
jgi:hypothetical protein